MRNSRYRRDPRQLEEDEEMWFNDEDEIEDEEQINEHKDLDDEFDQIGIGKILEKRGKISFINIDCESFLKYNT